jgi:hypothetical protein
MIIHEDLSTSNNRHPCGHVGEMSAILLASLERQTTRPSTVARELNGVMVGVTR